MTLEGILKKDGWQHDAEKDRWTHPKRLGHIEITIEGWSHKRAAITESSGLETLKEGFSEAELQEYLDDLESLGAA